MTTCLDQFWVQILGRAGIELIYTSAESSPLWEALKKALEEVLDSDEVPSPSVWAVAKQLNTTGSTLWYHHSDLCRRISAKYKRYKLDCKLKNIDLNCAEVRRVALEMHADGIEPTRIRIRRRMNKCGYLRDTQVSQEIITIRRELGYESP
jgi:hypothetical protein